MLEADPSLPNDNSINERLPTMISDARKAALFPYWDDIEMRNDNVEGGGIFIETTGNAPNRNFMVEWRARRNGINGPIDTDFAVFFHENSDSFDYVYKLTGGTSLPLGTMNGNAASVGVQGKSYGTNYTQYSYHFPVIFPGLKLTATRPAAICTQGSG